MRYFGSILVMLAAGLWIGGIVCIAIFAQSTFKVLGPDQRELAGTVTSRMFVLFGWIQLICAATGLLGAFLIYTTTRRAIVVTLFFAIAIAAVGALGYHQWLVPKMEGLRLAGKSTGDEFNQLHHISRYLLQGVGVALLIALIMLPAAWRDRATTTQVIA